VPLRMPAACRGDASAQQAYVRAALQLCLSRWNIGAGLKKNIESAFAQRQGGGASLLDACGLPPPGCGDVRGA